MKQKKIRLTFDQWVESGGTAGIYAKDFKNGRIEFVEDQTFEFEDEPVSFDKIGEEV